MKKIFPLLFSCLSCAAFAQKNPTEEAQPIVAEGKLLYRLEMASWYGTDIFLENYKNRENIGGYFSYMEGEMAKCIFFSAAEIPKVIGSILFDNTYKAETAKPDFAERDMTAAEKDIYAFRKIALAEMNADTLFKRYSNTNLNLIPLVNGDEKKVYVLTGPQKSGVVIIGNDYLMTFDKNNNILTKKQLHKNIIPIYYKTEEGENSVGAVHSHLPETGDFMTATDICTLMLYAKFANWKTHTVVSEKYLNLWNCETEQLTVIPRETMEKIEKDQEKRKKKNKREDQK